MTSSADITKEEFMGMVVEVINNSPEFKQTGKTMTVDNINIKCKVGDDYKDIEGIRIFVDM